MSYHKIKGDQLLFGRPFFFFLFSRRLCSFYQASHNLLDLFFRASRHGLLSLSNGISLLTSSFWFGATNCRFGRISELNKLIVVLVHHVTKMKLKATFKPHSSCSSSNAIILGNLISNRNSRFLLCLD